MTGVVKLTKAMEAAAQAHTNLNIFAAIETLLDGGHLSANGEADAVAIRRIVHRATARQLRLYDQALEAGRAALQEAQP